MKTFKTLSGNVYVLNVRLNWVFLYFSVVNVQSAD